MKKLLLILCLSLYTYISSAQERSKIGHFQGLTYYHEAMLNTTEEVSGPGEIVYYPEEEKQIDTVYIVEKVIIETLPRINIHFGMGWGFNHWNHWNSRYYGYYGYDPYYSYWGYPHHRYYGWNHYYGHNYYNHNYYAAKKKANNYKSRTHQRSTSVSQIRKPQRKVVSNSERRISRSNYEQKSRKTYTRDYDQMYPSSRIKATKSTRNTRYIAPQNKPSLRSNKVNSYKRNNYQKSNSNAYKSRSYSKSTPTRSKSYSSPSRSSSSFSSGSRSSSSSSGSRSSGTRSSDSSRGRRQ